MGEIGAQGPEILAYLSELQLLLLEAPVDAGEALAHLAFELPMPSRISRNCRHTKAPKPPEKTRTKVAMTSSPAVIPLILEAGRNREL